MRRLLSSLLTVATAFLVAPAVSSAATPSGGYECPTPDPATPKQQMRAEWIASVANIDWPSSRDLTAAQQQAELVRWYDEAVELGLNTVVVQVRPTADAFWPSPHEPWSHWLTGTQGQDPGYDPLGFAVAEAHKRNLEFHAWFNPYRVSMTDDPGTLVPEHPARVHPDWVIPYGGKLYYDPGLPEVRRFTIDAIMDAVTRYDIDAVHFDDYFYPYPVAGETFADADTYAEHGGSFDNIADWRRNNVDLLISELSSAIRAAKPHVQFGVSPFAIWRNSSTDPEGSPTQGGVETYDDLYADTRKWVREGWLDYIVPQVYWNIGFTVADYAKLVPWWSSVVSGTGVNLYIGQANYKVADPNQGAPWHDPNEMSEHLTFNRDHPEVGGDIYFSAVQVRKNALDHMGIVKADHYGQPAVPPTPARLEAAGPRAPVLATARRAADGVRLVWVSTDRRATDYAVYRVEDRNAHCATVDARHLVGVVQDGWGPLQSFVDETAERDGRYTYVVTALDRVHNESRASSPRRLG
ncbi:glycoside hydrolase family 10 protein [Actinophytocola gossypii]|uniref:Family 10 glycosylhydrolase n=1 Tax=Actinophytocola gossypii TaxID=2812003 RepID=A0ABT2J3T9_9PSEU|nr:family 10 glycosylhydrolase [Actinophytocola gossypii]MCT2582525.1 family 10 glycosylhydrolase [Actinophytocola gossypii]